MADRRGLRFLAGVVATLAIAACGSASSASRPSTDAHPSSAAPRQQPVIDVYASLPLSGPQAAQGLAVAQGVKTGLATLEQPAGHIGAYKVDYKLLNDANRRGWNATMAAGNAAAAAMDPHAGLYIGEFNSGATEVALPILNQAGIVELTPGSTYIGLTDSVKGVTQATEPDRFYPNLKLRNLLRLVPNQMVQSAAILDALAKVVGPCQRVAAVSFGGTDGAGVAAIQATAPDYNMTFVPTKAVPAGAGSAALAAYVQSLRTASVGCLVLTGSATTTSTALVRLVRADLPHVPVIGTSGYCKVTLSVAGWYCASPALPLADYPGGAAYTADYRRSISRRQPPSPYGVYGFMAAEVTVTAIEDLIDDGTDIRTQLQRALLGGDLVQTSQMIGAVEFDARGNLSNYRRVGLYRPNPQGRMHYFTMVSPSKVVGGS